MSWLVLRLLVCWWSILVVVLADCYTSGPLVLMVLGICCQAIGQLALVVLSICCQAVGQLALAFVVRLLVS